MKKTTWVFGSMLAAGCMLLSVPAIAQGNFPQGMPQGMPGGMPQGMPGGMGRNPGFQQPGAAGKANPAAQPGTKTAANAGKTNTTAKSSSTPAKNEKAALEAAKYQLSIHRNDLIRTTIDGYASTDDLADQGIVRDVMEDIEKQMPLVPSVPFERIDSQALNDEAKRRVEQEYGATEKNISVVEAEAAAEFPLYKVGDTVVVNYNMGPKHFSVKGKLYRVTDNSITVEDKLINFVDLSDEVRARFDPRKNEYMRARYIETHNHLINRLKIEKINDYYEKLKGEIFKRNETAGYIYDPQTGEWATAQEVAKNYIDRVLRDKSRTRPRTNPAAQQTRPVETVIDDDEEEETTVVSAPTVDTEKQNETVRTGITPVNDSIKIDDNSESQAKYQAVLAKAQKQKKEANENNAGIDADCGYKNACWGFTIGDARYALWHEPEFPHIKPTLGRDVIEIPPEGLDAEIDGDPASIDLVYISNSLSKVVFFMKDCSRQDFLSFKDSLTEQYGHAIEDKGVNSAAFNNIFSGKTKPQQIADADAIEEAQAAVKDAEKAFNKADSDLKNADDDNRSELQEARDEAATALKEAIAKAESFENAISADNLPYIYSRIKLAKDDNGNTVLPYAFNWKGRNVTGTLVFYYDKAKDKVTGLVFAKEFKK